MTTLALSPVFTVAQFADYNERADRIEAIVTDFADVERAEAAWWVKSTNGSGRFLEGETGPVEHREYLVFRSPDHARHMALYDMLSNERLIQSTYASDERTSFTPRWTP